MSGSWVPPLLSIADLLADQSVRETKEQADAQILSQVAGLTPSDLKPTLLQWARAGFPAAFPVRELQLSVPDLCSDGVCRCLADYIVFCSGKSIQDIVTEIQSRLADIEVSFYTTGFSVWIVVSRSTA
jgi:hypothetical protein